LQYSPMSTAPSTSGTLGRGDVRSMLPNPVDEGIMTFYAKPVLQRHGLWERLSGGKECKSCQPSTNAYFTAVHHREIPAAIKAGTTDVGIVWVTETRNELQAGSEVLSIRLPPEDSMVREVGTSSAPCVGQGMQPQPCATSNS